MIKKLWVRIPAEAARRIFLSRVNFLCSYSVSALPLCYQKTLIILPKNAGGKLHLNIPTPLTQKNQSGLTMLSRHSVETYQGNKLTHNQSGMAQPHSSQLAEPLWTNLGQKECNWCAWADLHFFFKKCQAGIESTNLLPKSSCEEKSHHYYH